MELLRWPELVCGIRASSPESRGVGGPWVPEQMDDCNYPSTREAHDKAAKVETESTEAATQLALPVPSCSCRWEG